MSLGSLPGCAARRWLVFLGTTVALLVPGVLGAHGGGLDAYGNSAGTAATAARSPGWRSARRARCWSSSVATTGRALVPKTVTPAPSGHRSTAERLEELAQLRQRGLITEDEYQAKRRAMLEGL